MKTLADVNVLFSLLIAGHPHHNAAWQWWQRQPDGYVGLCWLTRLAILRLLTNAKAMGDQPVSSEEALATWDMLAADPRCQWLEANATHEAFFRRFTVGRQASQNLWSDAWLAALASSQDRQVTSFDADFRTFQLSQFEHLLSC